MVNAGDALVWAVMVGSVDKVRHLLDTHAALVHAAGGPLNETPLHAAMQGECVEMVRLLVREGARLEEHNRYGATPLLTAAACGHSQVVLALLDLGADATARGACGRDVWGEAAYAGHVHVIQALLTWQATRAGKEEGQGRGEGEEDGQGREGPMDQHKGKRRGGLQVVEKGTCKDVEADEGEGAVRSALYWAIKGGRAEAVKCLMVHTGATATPEERRTARGHCLQVIQWVEGERERLRLLDHARSEHDRHFFLHHNNRIRGKVALEIHMWAIKEENQHGGGRGGGLEESGDGIAGEVARSVVACLAEDLYREVRGYMAL